MSQDPAAAVRQWVEGFVIGLDLCPFAAPVARRGAIRYAVVESGEVGAIAEAFGDALGDLLAADPAELATTLLVAPALVDFEDYLDVFDFLEVVLADSDLEGVVQIASFHPDYRFADADPDDVGNATNRPPFPVFHLLREDDVSRAVDAHPDVEGIPEVNLARLRALGWAEVRRRGGR